MDALAGAFGLKGWQLLIPGIKVAVAGSGQLDTLIKNYTEASEQGKNFIMRVAEKEAKYEK